MNQDLLDFEDYRERLRFKLTRPKKAQMPLAPEVYKSTGDSPVHVCSNQFLLVLAKYKSL